MQRGQVAYFIRKLNQHNYTWHMHMLHRIPGVRNWRQGINVRFHLKLKAVDVIRHELINSMYLLTCILHGLLVNAGWRVLGLKV
jgi:hypothetical protein